MTKPFTVEQLRCLELAGIIREGLEGVRFDMFNERTDDGCGTAGCIAGYACAVYARRVWDRACGDKIWTTGLKLLGLTQDKGEQLFAPWWADGPHSYQITPEMAAATLERFAMTGEVEWE